MLKLNPSIVFREDAKGALLFNPDDGKMTRLNGSGVIIWKYLEEGKDAAGIIEELQQRFPTVSRDVFESDVPAFLGMLTGKGYLAGFDGAKVKVDTTEAPRVLENRPIYEMYSMKRVFVPGDALVLEDCPFEKFVPGDIVAFYPNGKNAAGIVHRVIRRTADELTTMGDNNPKPDERAVTAADAPKKVIARILPTGVRFTVANGAAGMRTFRRNRLRRFLRRLSGALLRPFLPLMFWRKKPTFSCEFDSVTQYYYGRRLIARKTEHGIEYIPPRNKLLYKIEK